MAGQSLVAFQVDSRERAHELFAVLLRQDEADSAVTIIDAVCVTNEAGRLRIEQTTDATAGEGAFGGGVVGVVVGLMAGGPVGAVIGGLAGGALASLYSAVRDTGIPDARIREIAAGIPPGHAALVLLYSGQLSDTMLAMLRDYDGSLITEALPEGAHAAVQAALRRMGMDAAPGPIEVTVSEQPAHTETH